MSASKQLYRKIFEHGCQGMGPDKGPRPRYALKMNLSREKWDELKIRFKSTDSDLNEFFASARGYYYPRQTDTMYNIRFADILAGEVFFIIRQGEGANAARRFDLMKLNNRACLVLADSGTSQRGDTYPLAEPTLLSEATFVEPSPFHRLLDAALLRNYASYPVAPSVEPVVEHVKNIVNRDITLRETVELFDLVARHGLSTFALRTILDCYS